MPRRNLYRIGAVCLSGILLIPVAASWLEAKESYVRDLSLTFVSWLKPSALAILAGVVLGSAARSPDPPLRIRWSAVAVWTVLSGVILAPFFLQFRGTVLLPSAILRVPEIQLVVAYALGVALSWTWTERTSPTDPGP